MTYNALLNNPNYTQIASVKHEDIKSFMVSEVEQQPLIVKIANLYQITGILAFVLGGFKAFMPFFTHRETVYLAWLGLGILFSFSLLIIVHELIHAAAYRLVGVKNISFGMHIRKFMFYVQADKQLVNYHQFKIVALAPAVLVGALSILGMVVFYKQPAFNFFVPIFAFHSIFTGGDFGLLSFFQNRPDQEIVSYDLKSEGRTYFFAKQKN